MKQLRLTMLMVCLGVFMANAQWTQVGYNQLPGYDNPLGYGNSVKNSMTIHPQTGEPYVAMINSSNNHKVNIYRHDGASWVIVDSDVSPGAATFVNLHISTDGSFYLGFIDHTRLNRATVMTKAAGSTNWATLGSAGFTPGLRSLEMKVIDNHQPYNDPYIFVGYRTSSATCEVMYFTDTYFSQFWQKAGTTRHANYGSIATLEVFNKKVYLARESGNDVLVDRIDMNNLNAGWQTLGGGAVNSSGTIGIYPQLAFNHATNNISVFYSNHNSVADLDPRVHNFDGSNWNMLTTNGLTSGIAGAYPREYGIHPQTGEPYIIFEDYGNNPGGCSIMKLTANTWSYVGTAMDIPGYSVGLVFHPNTKLPYVFHTYSPSGTPDAQVEYFYDGCSRTVSSIYEQINSVWGGGAIQYDWEVNDVTNGASYYVSTGNNSYITISQIPGYSYNTNYQIRSKANYFWFGWTGWSTWCNVTSPAGLGEGRGGKTLLSDVESQEKAFSLYPNPTSGFITLSLGSLNNEFNTVDLSIYSLSGQVVRRIDQSAFNSAGELKLDLSSLPTGLYTLVGQANTRQIKEKIIVQ